VEYDVILRNVTRAIMKDNMDYSCNLHPINNLRNYYLI